MVSTRSKRLTFAAFASRTTLATKNAPHFDLTSDDEETMPVRAGAAATVVDGGHVEASEVGTGGPEVQKMKADFATAIFKLA